ncbi:MAG: HAMP domain-containing protein [Deltaproteobacteria bacterium]|nr:HAMP domain-containing protein [Deltaproteobacteria bacterium]
MRLRRKLTIAFFLTSSAVSVLLAFVLYRFIEGQLHDDVRDRLRDITLVGSRTIDIARFTRLRDQIGPGEVAAATVSEIEHSDDYRAIYGELRRLRTIERKGLLRFAYLLAPTTGDPTKPRFVVDADVLELLAKVARGEPLPAGGVSHFGQEYPAEDIPLLVEALSTCEPRYEPSFVHDEEFDVNSVSAYVPLTDLEGKGLRDARGNCLGVMGVDISDREMREALDKAGNLAIWISLGVIALALLVSIALGTVLTRSILALTATVKRFADKDFSARTPILSRDEIGQLGENFNAMATTIQQHSENLEGLVIERTSELYAEQQTSERLLLNVLPAPIAERLKHGESLIVDRFDAVSVMFADLVGFTAMSAVTTPEELVTMLNELFSMMDRLAEKHGLEKIKTIGDAYMVVAGVPQPIADHAVAITHMGIDIVEGIAAYARKIGRPLSIRIGIHSGSVVAGVIGTKKFIYDLWGDTVNTASRMESHGLAGRVHVSDVTYRLLKDQFDFEERGTIEVKGKGPMTTYLLVGQRVRDPANRFSIPQLPLQPPTKPSASGLGVDLMDVGHTDPGTGDPE